MANDLIGLRTLLTLDDVELDFVTFFQTFVPINLDGAVVDEDVGAVVSSDEAVPFRIVEPFDFACILSHEPCPSWKAKFDWAESPTCLLRDADWGGLVFLLVVEEG